MIWIFPFAGGSQLPAKASCTQPTLASSKFCAEKKEKKMSKEIIEIKIKNMTKEVGREPEKYLESAIDFHKNCEP